MKRRSKVGVSLAKTLRLKGAKAKRLAPGSISPSADETGAIARLTRERDEALEQQAATSQVLQLISSSPGDLQAIFLSILENAVRICDASFGDIGLWKDGTIRLVAIHKTTPPAFAEQRKRTQNVPPAANSPIARMLATKTPVHIPDLQHDRAYLERSSPVTIAVVELGGVRTFLGVPMLKGNEVVGMLFLSRQFVQPFTDKQIELVKNFAAQAVIAIENARLLNELRKRTTDLGETLEQQTATTDVLRVISTSRGETAPVFQTMLQSAVQLCHAKFGAMYYCEGSAFRTVAIHNAPPAFQAARLNTLVHPNPLSGLGRVVETKQFVQIEDMAAEPAYAVRDAMRVAAVELGGVRSLLCVPMIKESAVVGAITIYRDVVGQFTEKQIELVKNFASQAVIAIENARLLNELRQRTEDLSQRTTSLTEALEQQTATSEVLRVISSSQGELQPVFESILANATSVCQAQFGHLLLCEGDAFRNVAMCDVPIALVEKVRGQLFRPHSESPLAQAAITKEPVQVHDLMVSRPYLDGHPAIVAQVELGGTRTLVAVPMLGGSGLVGVIILYRNKVHPFTDKQIDLVKNFAAQAVIAIENARLLNELRLRTTDLTEALEQQTATSDVLQVISGSPDNLQPVFAAMLERAVRICDAKFGTLYLAEGGKLRLVAAQQAPEFVEARTAAFEPALGGAFYETMRTKQVVHVPDLAVTKLYAEREPTAVAAVELGGVRTAMAVPMLKDDKVIGIITIVRQEVRLFADKQIALVTNFAAQAVIAIENARLLNELRQSLAQQTATADVLRVISSSPGDLEPVFSTMLENAVRICDANFGNIYRWDSDALHLVATCNTPPAFADARRFSFSNRPGPKTVTGRMLASKDLVHVVDTTTEPGYGDESDPGAVAAVELGGARTILAVPMRKEDELIGSFTVYRQEVRPFTDKQIELVKNFAAQAVIAIENARLLNELRQRTTDLSESLEQQTATSEVLQVISSSASDLRPVFASMVENGIRLCSANFGALTLLEGDAYRIGAMHNMPSGFAERWQGLMIRPGPLAPLVRAATSKDCVHIGDLSQDAAYIERDPNVVALVDGGHVRTILVVPMLKEQKFVGALSIYRQEKRPFTTKQIELIKNFASQAVIAIENARLLNELKQSLEQQTATSEVLGVISRSKFDLQPILQSVVDTALRLCRADAASIFRLDGGFYRWAVGLNDDPAYREIEQQTPIPPGQGTLVGRVALSRKVARIDDAWTDPLYEKKGDAKVGGFHSMIGVPLMRDGEPIGVIALARKRVEPFLDREIELVTTFADQAVIAIENVRLFEAEQDRTHELTKSLEDLRTAQDRLVQTQKLASLGQLTAGIAHEIKNPLNFVNNFSGVSTELLDELREALGGVKADDKTRAEITELASTLRDNLNKIVQHGKRADSIVKNMLLHSREGSGEYRLVDINALVEEAVNLAYHGARAEKQGFNITLERTLDRAAGQVDCFPQEITRVLLNLISNGFYAATQRKGQAVDDGFEPKLTAATKNFGDRVEISIRDNGIGISPEVREKMFNPFFTTKPAGEGTGLGLSITHDIIVKQHSGSIEVDTQPGEFTEIRIVLPRAAAGIAAGQA